MSEEYNSEEYNKALRDLQLDSLPIDLATQIGDAIVACVSLQLRDNYQKHLGRHGQKLSQDQRDAINNIGNISLDAIDELAALLKDWLAIDVEEFELIRQKFPTSKHTVISLEDIPSEQDLRDVLLATLRVAIPIPKSDEDSFL